MKVLETIAKTATPGVAVFITLFPFYCMLNADDRFKAFSKVLDLLLGNMFLGCIIFVLIVIIFGIKYQNDAIARVHAEERQRLEQENKTLREDLNAFTREMLSIKEKKNR